MPKVKKKDMAQVNPVATESPNVKNKASQKITQQPKKTTTKSKTGATDLVVATAPVTATKTPRKPKVQAKTEPKTELKIKAEAKSKTKKTKVITELLTPETLTPEPVSTEPLNAEFQTEMIAEVVFQLQTETAELETSALAEEVRPQPKRRGRPAKVKASDQPTEETFVASLFEEPERPKPELLDTVAELDIVELAAIQAQEAESNEAETAKIATAEIAIVPQPKRGRGRPPKASLLIEPTQPAAEELVVIAPPQVAKVEEEIILDEQTPLVVKRGRGRPPKQAPILAVLDDVEVIDLVETTAVLEAVLETVEVALAENIIPLILEVPKPKAKRGREPKATQEEVSLSDVLTGVEVVEVSASAALHEETNSKETNSEETGLEALKASEEIEEISFTVVSKAETPTEEKARIADAKKALAVRRKGRKPDFVAAKTKPVAPALEVVGVIAEGETEVNPNPARDIVVGQLRKLGRPVHVRDLERTFTRQMINRLGDWRDLESLLESIVETGEVIRTRRRTYGLPEAMSLVRGRFQASAAGFGFVIPDSGGEDFYVSAEQTLEAWNGDIVLVRMEGRGDSVYRGDNGYKGNAPKRGQKGDGNPRASVVRIVQRAYKQLVGTLEFHHGHPILKPDDYRARHRILVLPEGLEGLEEGARVVTELFWPENTGEDEVFGQVSRVLGDTDNPTTETEAVIVKFGLHGTFPEEVEAEAGVIPTSISEDALNGRLDLRSFNIFTVDGRDAKDFDDAIHIQPTPEGTFVVGIHIADVSQYVCEGTPLDTEAYARATSVYLPGRVLPMLPEHLSNGVCSLVPYEDRLTMTALIELSAEGEILKVQVMPSVINSKARLTYDEVQAYSEATATLPEHARQLEGDLHLLLKITTKLRQKRLREGSLDFKLREVKVDINAEGKMELIPIREETARGMIEDLMLLANKVVAHYLIEREIPTLFRIHEEPTLQRFQEVSSAIGRMGLAFPGGVPTPQSYQAVLKQVRGTSRESVVNTLLLRSMQQAKYAGENLGHFGLAFDEYLHFTSPIRRYPDLMVHRVLKQVLSEDLKAGSRAVAELQARLPEMGVHTSTRERTAAEAERNLTKYYQAKWAQEHVGQSFAANVSGVVASGLFIVLENGVEGKMHISNLDDDYYVFIEDAQMLRGRSKGRSFRLGNPLMVTISSVNPLARQTDFVMADPTDSQYHLGNFNQEKDMDSPVKPRARRREERVQERQEKLKTVQVSEPKKFTLDEPAPSTAVSVSPVPARRGRPVPAERTYQPRERSQTQSQGQTGPSTSSQGGPSSQGGSARTFGGVAMRSERPSSTGSSYRRERRVVTLERPRNEHLRPVNITVQRMYFGDWTLENMPSEDEAVRGRGGQDYTRSERTSSIERTGRGGYSRGANDKGAVQRVNGPSSNPANGNSNGTSNNATNGNRAAAVAPAAASSSISQSEEERRRRRRRGRRGPTGSGTT